MGPNWKCVLRLSHLHRKFFSSLLEKRDVDALEEGSDTHKLFLEQGDLDDQKAKEVAEYIDAKNKEVIYRELKNNIIFFLFFSDFSSVQSMLDKQEASGHVVDEHLKDQMAAVHSQVWLNYGFSES